MKRVAIIGHYGVGLDLANGQTIKTKIVTEAIENKYQEKVKIVDAHGGIRAVIPVILGCIFSLFTCKNVLVMLTENGLKVSVPILSFFNRICKRKLHYVVIGGWLPKFLEKQPKLEKKLKMFDYIYVETKTMKKALDKKGFFNVVVMPNCKELTVLSEEELEYQKDLPLSICTFSRVMKEKGIEELVNAVNEINKTCEKYKLDIYGQIDSSQIEWFDNIKSMFPPNVKYKGVIPFDKSVETLKQYYMLVFPTLFFTEGIPGTIIDGYAAGVPVLSSKWESFSDVVDDQVTGIGYEFNSYEALIKQLEYCSDNIEVVNKMKRNCLCKSREFTIEHAMKVLFDNLK